jgi:DNA-binding MarR family transcriptional regulator
MGGFEADKGHAHYELDEGGYLFDRAFREKLVTFKHWLDADGVSRAETLRALIQATRKLDQMLQEGLDGLGLGQGQCRALLCVRQMGDDGALMHQIAAFLGVTPRNVTGLIDGLEELGLVERVADPRDRRATIVRLTTAGEAAAVRSREIHEAVVGGALNALTDQERLQLRHLCTKLLRATEEMIQVPAGRAESGG